MRTTDLPVYSIIAALVSLAAIPLDQLRLLFESMDDVSDPHDPLLYDDTGSLLCEQPMQRW